MAKVTSAAISGLWIVENNQNIRVCHAIRNGSIAGVSVCNSQPERIAVNIGTTLLNGCSCCCCYI